IAAWEAARGSAPGRHDDFGADGEGSRGVEYVQAQALNRRARETGIRKLLGFAETARRTAAGDRPVLVDLLGGDGLVRKVCEELGIGDFNILTCDASPHMVTTAWAAGVPALLQRAEQPLLRDHSVDAVLLAYGSHHVPSSDRQTVATEARRMLRPGGTFVLHDFLVGSPVDVWFEEVTDVYSATGHKFLHFTRGRDRGVPGEGRLRPPRGRGDRRPLHRGRRHPRGGGAGDRPVPAEHVRPGQGLRGAHRAGGVPLGRRDRQGRLPLPGRRGRPRLERTAPGGHRRVRVTIPRRAVVGVGRVSATAGKAA
ncbi:class I SAM-dependent methyltransferase, partial [Streptomyces anthocyanicus]